jgi:hypothetical protein
VNPAHALHLLSECTGQDIWSVEYCQQRNVPQAWVIELRDAYESGFESSNAQIFYRDQWVNQFEGVRDVDLACKIGQFLKVDVASIVQMTSSRAGVVRAIREAIEES